VSGSKPQPVYLDCDPGVDDALALAYLLASPEIELVGIGSVHGNVSADEGARNALDLLGLAGRSDVPVAVGAADPLSGGYAGGVPHIHGSVGIGNVELPRSSQEPVTGSAAELLVRLAWEHPGLHVVTIGPLTNVATALRLDPGLVDRVSQVTAMGGAALVPGNISAVAEANIANDPEAAAAVLAAPWDVTLVPLDVTMEAVLEESDRERLATSESTTARTLADILDLYYEFYVGTYGRRCCALHDPLAAAIAVGGIALRTAPVVSVVVDATDGPGRGQTICDLRGHRLGYPTQPGAHCRVVLELAEDFAPQLMERLLRCP
jgi:purine nucleosidase